MWRRGHRCTTAQHWRRSAKDPSSHHLTVTCQRFCVGSAGQSSIPYSTKSIAIRIWAIRQMFREAEARGCKIYGRECRRNRKGWSNIKWRSTMYTNPQCRWNSQATTFYGNQWYTCTHTKTMYDVCAHSSLPTSAILALGLLKKKEERRWWTIMCGRR